MLQLIISTYRRLLYTWYSFTDRNHDHWVQLGSRKFLFLDQLAQGGSGTVYRVIELDAPTTCNEWVIKRVNASDNDHCVAFHNEVQQHLSTHDHPRIMPLIASDLVGANNSNVEAGTLINENGGTQGFLLMPLLRNGDLQQFVESRFKENDPLPSDLILRFLRSICAALLAFHHQDPAKVVGDLKPANLLVCEDRQSVLLTDLGSVSLARRQISTRTQAVSLQDEYAVTISAPYRPPECFSVPSQCVLDTRTDVWSLGCVLYFMVTGQCAFDGTESSARSRLEYGGEFAHLLEAMLRVGMEQRPSVDEVVLMLDQM